MTNAQIIDVEMRLRADRERRREAAIASRHEHSILSLCRDLHGAVTGSGDPMTDERLYGLTQWLIDRLEYAWTESPEPRGTDMETVARLATRWTFDGAVRDLAHATVRVVIGSDAWRQAMTWRREQIAAGAT